MSRDLPTLLRDTAVEPTREVDAAAVVTQAERRTAVHRAGAGAAVLAVAGAVVGSVLALQGLVYDRTVPPVVDQPPPTDDEGVEIPEGWVTLRAGDLAVSVPPEWEVVDRYAGRSVPGPIGGPCVNDLHAPNHGAEPATAPVAVVYDRPTSGFCRGPGYDGGPAQPGLVLYVGIDATVATGRTVEDGRLSSGVTGGERDRIGSVDVRRVGDPDGRISSVDEWTGIVRYVPVDLTGALWVSHADDPVVQRILSTVRERDPSFRDPPPVEQGPVSWEVLATFPVASPVDEVVRDQERLDARWVPLGSSEDTPELPEASVALVVTPTEVGAGPCARLWEVDGVDRDGDTAVVSFVESTDLPCVGYVRQLVLVPEAQVRGVEHIEQRYPD